MIKSAKEFVRLRESSAAEAYRRASDEPAPESVWLEVIEHFPAKREWVAHNKTIPVSIIQILAADEDPSVRMTIAQKRRCPPNLLAQLARDPEASVRARVAYNAKTPVELLHELSSDAEPHVATAAARRLSRKSATRTSRDSDNPDTEH